MMLLKKLFVLAVIAAAGCSGSKQATTVNPITNNVQTTGTQYEAPACINKLIDGYKAEKVQNPPRSVYSYTYNGSTVYYVPALCCDFFSDLYDSSCNVMAHPDGGYTGRGDGSMPDFARARTNEKLLWKDERK
jgi:hypothetical protein